MQKKRKNQRLPYPAGTSRLVLRMAHVMLLIGLPAHRVESALHLVARRLGLRGVFMATPTTVFAALGDGLHQRTMMTRAEGRGVDLDKLADLSEVIEDLETRDITVPESANKLEAIAARPARYNAAWNILGFTLTSLALGMLFSANLYELPVAAFIGLLVGLVSWAMARTEQLSRLFEPAAAALAALAAVLIGSRLPQISPFLVTLAGLIILLPGLSITLATRELADGELVAGGARMAGAALVLLFLTFGMALGTQIGYLFVDLPPTARTPPLPGWTQVIAVAVMAFALTVLLNARWREFPWILAACALGAAGGILGSAWLGDQVGPFIGGLAVGLAGNVFSRMTGRPATIMQYPGLIMLVPGSVGFTSFTSLVQANVLGGVQTAFMAVMVAMALTAGLLVASLILPPKRDL